MNIKKGIDGYYILDGKNIVGFYKSYDDAEFAIKQAKWLRDIANKGFTKVKPKP